MHVSVCQRQGWEGWKDPRYEGTLRGKVKPAQDSRGLEGNMELSNAELSNTELSSVDPMLGDDFLFQKPS